MTSTSRPGYRFHILQKCFWITTVLCTQLVLAGPVEDAAKLMEEGAYAEVDKALAPELAKREPGTAVLRLSLDAAEAQGNYVTANQRIAALLFAGEGVDPELTLRAARIADRMGNRELALSRYFQYTEMVKQDGEALREALSFLIEHGTYPQIYTRFLAIQGADEGSWRAGHRLLQRLLQGADAENALMIARVLIENFSEDDRLNTVHAMLSDAASNFLLGRDDGRFVRPLEVMLLAQGSNWGPIAHVFRSAEPQLAISARLDALFKMQANTDSPMHWDPLHRFANLRSLDSDEARLNAGRRYLALEALFRDHENRDFYANWLRIIIESPQVFAIADKQLMPPAAMVARIELLISKFADEPVTTIDHHVRHAVAYYLKPENPERQQFLTKHIKSLWQYPLEQLIRDTEGKSIDQQLQAWGAEQDMVRKRDMYAHLMPLFNQYEKKELLQQAASWYMMGHPSNFNRDHLFAHYINSALVTTEEKLALLKEFYGKVGSSRALEALIERMNNHKEWQEAEGFTAFKAEVDKDLPGSDPILSTHAKIVPLDRGDRTAAHMLIQTMLGAVNGKLPGGPEGSKTIEDAVAIAIISDYLSICFHDAESMRRLGEQLIPRMQAGRTSLAVVNRLREHSLFDLVHQAARLYLPELKAGNIDEESRWFFNLSLGRNAADDTSMLFPEDMWAQVGPDSLFRYMMHNWSSWDKDRAAYTQLLTRIVTRPDFQPTDWGQVRTAIDRLYHASSATTPTPVELTTRLWEFWLGHEQQSGKVDPYAEAQVYGHLARSGHQAAAAAWLSSLQPVLASRPLHEQFNVLANLVQVVGMPTQEPGELQDGHQRAFILKELLPVSAKLRGDAGYLYNLKISERAIGFMNSTIIEAEKWPADVVEQAQAQSESFMRLLIGGGEAWGHWPNFFRLADLRARQLATAGNWSELGQVVTWYARYLRSSGNWDANYHQYILPLHTALENAGAHEIAFIFVDTIEKQGLVTDEILKQLLILKAKSSQHMLGIVTINRNDPSYALQQAAFEYALGNEAKAWDLTASKLKLLPEVWQSLDQQYMAWTIEQMRKQKLLDEALQFSFSVLLQENDLDPEVAANVALTKGDIYRDMENFQAARIEYQALTSNRRYTHTKAGFKSQFRLIELLILTRNYADAEQHLERLIYIEDVQLQAEAYYLYAKMMFDQEQYREAVGYLNKVKDRVVNHVEAAFLQGELNLRMPGGLQHTEVPVGNPRLSTVAIPGRDLTLKLQDSNLAIAREKGAIPVIITTTRGDLEHLRLLPSATNRNLFEGVIATSLGPVTPNNLRLELSGDDIVSYVIDPEFQRANDISYPPKELIVKSDARLVASSGEILSEEEEEQRRLQQRMMETRGASSREQFYFRNPNTIRPGNPIYVQVRDYDQSVSSEKDTVTVTLKTQSGDVLEDFELTETGPYTGIFRGAVPTGIPFPKAIVSDSREDRDPSVMINTTKDATWGSLADGRKPKWVEVDTMSSDEVKEVYLEMPDTSEIRRVTLMGMLSEDWQPLASWPEEQRQGGTGVQVEYFASGGFATLFAARFVGMLKIPADGDYMLYLTSDDGSKLWLGDEQIIDNDGLHGMEERTARRTLTAGDHPLRIDYYQGEGGSGLTLHIAGPGMERQIVPAAMLVHTVGDQQRPGLQATYYRIASAFSQMPSFDGLVPVIQRVDSQINFPSTEEVWANIRSEEQQLLATETEPLVSFDWRRGSRPYPAGVDGRVEVRVTGRLRPRFTENHKLFVYSDDGIRLTVDGKVLIDEWRNSGHREASAEIELEAGKYYDLVLESFDRNGDHMLSLSWESASLEKELVPQDCLYLPGEGEPEEQLLPVEVTIANNQHGATPDQISTYLRVAPTVSWRQQGLRFERNKSPWPRQSWYTSQMRTAFYMPENGTLELRFTHQPPPHQWQHCWLFVNSEMVLGGPMNENTIERSRRIPLTQGVHTLRILNRDHWGASEVSLQYRRDDGTYGDLPKEWFDPAIYPELAEYLKPSAKLEITENRLSAELFNARRLRKLRWVFDDFSSAGIEVKAFGIVNAAGKLLVPGKEDFTSASLNRTLEIAPGDSITVTYQDQKRLREDTPELTINLNSQYHNGTIVIANEEFYTDYHGRRLVRYQPARRVGIGDQVVIMVEEYDADVSDKRDTLPVTVTTSSGERLELVALETMPNYDEEWHAHAGRFQAILKIGEKTGGDTIGVKSGDVITATYLDTENTSPGIPIERSYSLREGGSSKPELVIYRTSTSLVEDTSVEAQVRRERMRKQYRDAVILRPEIVARHPSYRRRGGEVQDLADGRVVVDVNAPLLFEVIYPAMARHSGSTLNVSVLADSEIEAAKAENRAPKRFEMPLHVYGIEEMARFKGYQIRLQSHQRRGKEDMLTDGMFAGVMRLQVGSIGDVVDDLVVSGAKEFTTMEQRQDDEDGFFYRVPTLIVSGSDTLHISVYDEGGEELVKESVELRADGRIELLERTYTVQNRSIYLGESFYLKVTDPDRDTTNQQDTVEVIVSAASGDRMVTTLTETLAHSGVFTGSIRPVFLGEAKDGVMPEPKLEDDVLQVVFGDEVTFTYVDPLPLNASEPVTIEETGRIHYGSDAQLASFSKLFKDPEMAVKTRFLMAEALFEMAKQKRKLEQEDEADEHIAEGKQILEEAMRDHPDTSLASQGEYLLANLAEELEDYQEAIGRYSHVIRTWPESEYAARSQFKMALCLEKLENYTQAAEEYVRLTYVYPESSLVADAVIRLASHYYKEEKFSVAGKIFRNFQRNNRTHDLAPRALFLAAQCHIKEKAFDMAAELLTVLIAEYQDERDLRSEGMYWLADSYYQLRDYRQSYQTFRKLTWDYPESQWAKYARGRLTDEQMIRAAEGENR